MKIFKSFCVLFLALSIKAQANETAHEAAAMPAPTCTAETDKNCSEGHAATTEHESTGAHHGPKTAAKDWSHKRQQQVAAILPEKTKAAGQDARPEKVKLVSPKFLAKISGETTKLEWSEVAGAKNYHVQVSKDAGFNNRSMYVAEDKLVTGTTFEVKNLEPGVKYFWRVAAVNPDLESQFTKSAFTFSSFETESK